MSLSVIVCAYNEEKTITNKIKDILAKDKTDKVREIIVIDDNSSDETFAVAENCSRDNKRLKVIKNAHREGKWGAIATGLESAQGEIVCLTDADVSFQEDTIDKALRLFDDPLVGGVTSNQKITLVRNGKENTPLVNFYEKFRNFFRIVESRIDSTIAFHGQCMFFRKDRLKLTESNSMADDLDIAIKIRRNKHRTLFCNDSYYIEKMSGSFDEISRRIFRRRAKAVAQTIINNKDILFNFRYKQFGLICFPIEFFINIILPFLIIAALGIVAIGALLFPFRYKTLFIIAVFFSIFNRRLLLMVWYQATAMISCLFNSKNSCIRWTTPRYKS